ncbi:MAG: hypothetical protein AB8B94_00880 [Hyphomicrobiales bacterium]
MTSFVSRMTTRIPYIAKQIKRRQMAKILYNLDHRALKDVGVFRSEIDAFVYESIGARRPFYSGFQNREL